MNKGWAVEVEFSWGVGKDRQVLGVTHLGEGEGLVVGEAGDAGFLVPREVLGADRVEVLRRWGDAPVVVVPTGARLRVDGAPRAESSLHLTEGRVAELAFGAFALRMSVGTAEEPLPLPFALEEGAVMRSIAGSAAAHLAVVGILASFMPALGADAAETEDRDRLVLMQALLDASQQREMDRSDTGSSDVALDDGSNAGAAAVGESGKMGHDVPNKTGSYRLQKVSEDLPPAVAREREVALAKDFGMIGLLNASMNNERNALVAPWGSIANGNDDTSVLGSLFGPNADDATGTGGLGLGGIGEGGGGVNPWVGLRGFSGLGHVGTCTGADCGEGIGNHRGIVPGTHDASHFKGPRPAGDPQITGHIPAEVIQRIVRQNFGRFRLCYENGLRRNESLAGRVAVRFVIGRSGGVTLAQDSGSDLPDQGVRQCVVSSFSTLSFPEPEGGIVTVVYPIAFSPE
jgi:hypothetical protein